MSIQEVLNNCEEIDPIRIGSYLDHVKISCYFMPDLNVQLSDYIKSNSNLHGKENTAFILHWIRTNT